jgi:riboflavin synthase
MFTGLVEAQVPVLEFEIRGGGARLVLPTPSAGFEAALGDSISVSGCCLTVSALLEAGPDAAGPNLEFELSRETLDCTWFAELAPGRRVNLERAMQLGDRLGGHLVSGHVDGGGEVVSIRGDAQAGWTFRFRVDEGLERYLTPKGSATLDGISLTVNEPQGTEFWVAVIPVTFAETTLGTAEPGQRINVEVDLVGKWIEKLMPPR